MKSAYKKTLLSILLLFMIKNNRACEIYAKEEIKKVDINAMKKRLNGIPLKDLIPREKQHGLRSVLIYGFHIKKRVLGNDTLKIIDLIPLARYCQHIEPALMKYLLANVKLDRKGIAEPKKHSDYGYQGNESDFIAAEKEVNGNSKSKCDSCELLKKFITAQLALFAHLRV